MEQQYLMDSNAIIDFFNGKLNPAGKNFVASCDPRISVITQIELLSNKNIPSTEWEQLQTFIQIATVYTFDDSIVEKTIMLRQQYRIKIPDAVIAATALLHELSLITKNVLDFKNIAGLIVINPHSL